MHIAENEGAEAALGQWKILFCLHTIYLEIILVLDACPKGHLAAITQVTRFPAMYFGDHRSDNAMLLA